MWFVNCCMNWGHWDWAIAGLEVCVGVHSSAISPTPLRVLEAPFPEGQLACCRSSMPTSPALVPVLLGLVPSCLLLLLEVKGRHPFLALPARHPQGMLGQQPGGTQQPLPACAYVQCLEGICMCVHVYE